jgi:hypothetical protein
MDRGYRSARYDVTNPSSGIALDGRIEYDAEGGFKSVLVSLFSSSMGRLLWRGIPVQSTMILIEFS